MRPTFLGFEAGRRGLAVAQKGLDITGQNLSNIATPGYTRQRIDQVSVSAYGITSRSAGNKIGLAGQGVDITGVSQIRNSYLDRRFREEFGETYYYQQKVDILGDLADVVDQYSEAGSGLTAAVQQISQALQGLTSDKATDRTSMNILRTAFQGMVQVLHESSQKLDKVAEQQKYDLSVAVDDVNSMLTKLASLNEQIFNEVALNPSDSNVYKPNELMDSRNLLLDELSKYGDLEVIEQGDGTVTVKLGGKVVVDGSRAEKLGMIEREGGTVGLVWNSDTEEAHFGSGALKASVEMINGRGPDIQSPYESPEKGVMYYKDQLNTFARTLASVMNSVLPAELDEEGNPVKNPDGSISYKTLFGAQNPDGSVSQTDEITAANITISAAWADDVSYAFPSLTSKSNAQYFQKMNDLLMKDKGTVFQTRGQSFTGSFLEFINEVHTTCATEESLYAGRLEASAAITDSLLNERDSISSVSEDEETTNMMTYQKSYQAISRIMTAMDEMLDVVINQMGLVGR